MTNQPDYSKIYTHAPEQHPNLILGSLQLLFWMFFLPTAYKNHLKRIHPVLESNTSLITVLRRESDILKNPALWKFILQGFVILPVLLTVVARAIVILFLLTSGMPLQEAIS
ncbi:MAG: ATP-binding protein, partial [Rivularia sp. (in: cyanobacteria)]